MAASDLSKVYGEEYYEGYYDRSPKWFTFFDHIAHCLIEQFQPKKTLDAGCAWGLLVEMLRDRSVEAFGIDFSPYAISQVRPDLQPYCRRGSLVEPIAGGPYDIVSCIEVLEHMEEAYALQAIENIVAVADVVLFSSTPSNFADPTHINVRPVVYWLRAFAKHGYYPIPGSDAYFVSEQAFLVRKSAEPSSDDALHLFAEVLELRAETRRMAGELQTMAPNPSAAPVAVPVASPESAEILWRAEDALLTLQDIRESPGWQLVRQYRSWLRALRVNRPAAFPVWEKAASRALSTLVKQDESDPALAEKNWDYSKWIAENEPTQDGLREQQQHAGSLAYRPKISVVMPVYEISLETLRAAVDSLHAQTYDNWELCASVISTLNPDAAAMLAELATDDARIRVCRLESNLGISGNSDHALNLATGEFIALLDHDDTLAPFALYEVAKLLNEDPAANFIYSDRDELSEDGLVRSHPFFKPPWSPQILMSANYLTHVCVMRTELVRKVGGWREETDGAQDWDLFLRVIHEGGGVRHIPKILYHWRHARTSVASQGLDAKPYAREAQARTVQSYCRSVNLTQSAAFADGNPKIVWRLSELPSVSLIVLSREVSAASASRAGWMARRPECETVEVICAAPPGYTGFAEGVTLKEMPSDIGVVEQAERLVSSANGEVLVFVDATIRVDASDWLREIVGPLLLPDVGLCGCHLVNDETGNVRHAGISFHDTGDAELVRPGRRRLQFLFGWDQWLRNWSAVSGACFAIRRETWDAAGGLGVPNAYSRPDIRLCLKLAQQGLRVVTSPLARLRQTGLAALEMPLQFQEEADRQIVRSVFPAGDPYVNANLRLRNGELIPR